MVEPKGALKRGPFIALGVIIGFLGLMAFAAYSGAHDLSLLLVLGVIGAVVYLPLVAWIVWSARTVKPEQPKSFQLVASFAMSAFMVMVFGASWFAPSPFRVIAFFLLMFAGSIAGGQLIYARAWAKKFRHND